ncbi:unnamed protein product [Didymodactylos carnosus]|uniref:G-protein coupled receptors family 1 profile domain-containing protein n=1 Tax=Didymodactylos carnosus TaxID=1234261 RepID=A0A814N741_9BILA|nr:unnamed protein product [Didymodactylos carnosus]CAF1214009.1 unnamed protein product [Didymodactylos carnosus]CAF3854832.1 unnamed protein product [Didymodactylos carnosus]CAF4022720.1 unnamed protein product [Didymodactylos carnosus]
MFASSTSTIIITVPPVILQCFLCGRLCYPFLCKLEGFSSYLNGCACMYMLLLLSFIRYTSVMHTTFVKKLLERYNYLAVSLCWAFGLVWAVPPLFGWNRYVPEGLGFHCGLDWTDPSIRSILYFCLSFVFVYFLPLAALLYVNIRVYCTIRYLMHYGGSNESAYKNHWLFSRISSSSPSTPSSKFESLQLKTSLGSNLASGCSTGTIRFLQSGQNEAIHMKRIKSILARECSYINDGRDIRRQLADELSVSNSASLKRLKVHRRFAVATAILVSEYLLSWTPYATIAMLEIFRMILPSQNPVIMTICSLIAKLSVIINPCIYIQTITMLKLMPTFLNKCKCPSCQTKRSQKTKTGEIVRRFDF